MKRVRLLLLLPIFAQEMAMKEDFTYDVIVIGAGHAGCEAAHAAARMGMNTCLVTMDMNKIAQMSCNPAIGGIAKGQIVREVDALGGLMGEVTDAATIQFKMLNRSKGPAMWSPRAQCDRVKYSLEMRKRLENTENLHIWQDEIARIEKCNDNFFALHTLWGATMEARCVIITAGTFLNGLMHVGRQKVEGGRCAEPSSKYLTDSLRMAGLKSKRMKTGTPVRVDARSVHFEDMQEDTEESDFHRFSYVSVARNLPQMRCWTCQTNAEVHEILRRGLPDSPLYNGQIQSIGPRYCPSIETKLVTFPDRNQHPLFLEPEGTDTNELYLNGFSSSLPLEIQLEALKKIPALRDVKIYRPGYAIEYDFFDPTLLHHTLESKIIEGLFLAGQVNGTTGYEEAAGQGIVAGINAALKCTGKEGFTLKRDEAYIGVLIDDLVTKGVDEPYRMFTSRAEFRILLRQDNADIRLTPYAIKLGLAEEKRVYGFQRKEKALKELLENARTTTIKPQVINPFLAAKNSTPVTHGIHPSELVQRPELRLKEISDEFGLFPGIRMASNSDEIIEAAEVELKYQGYIARERQLAEKMRRLESIHIRGHFTYKNIHQLSTEARQKLEAIDPETLGQASRIPGVSPSDISVLLILSGR